MYNHGNRSCLQWFVNGLESGWLKIPLQVDTIGYTTWKLTIDAAMYHFSSLVPLWWMLHKPSNPQKF